MQGQQPDARLGGEERASVHPAGRPDGGSRERTRQPFRKGRELAEERLEVIAGRTAQHADATGRDTRDGSWWTEQAGHARRFVDAMRNDDAGAAYLWTGTSAGTAINRSVIPLDAQTWSVLRTRTPVNDRPALDWALKNCRQAGRRDAFDFNCRDGDGAWWEGTAQVAAALHWLGRDRDAAPVLSRLREAQLREGIAAGALPAASRCGLTTGFDLSFGSGRTMPWLYPDWPHVGATAWFAFAALGINPYHVTARAAGAR